MAKTKRPAAKKRKAPWDRPAPKKSKAKAKHTTLTPTAKAAAKKRAKRAGRRYPNLVDNMRAAADQK